ncbi:F0F1 ATP synthase subunit C [Pectinatus frisingensis]|jgi:F-type H+-transporting ATPase subunit c|uniref:F0F1 ATP synthase subunit C n=1 Tax=Pectinatus frisingensis TaxID=865 RepID=UPI0015F3C0F8|nr:F0F1 ATP synthase subunit C [Pectinatus frisingensis]
MESSIAIAAALVGVGVMLGLAALGAALGDGLVTGKMVEGISRQPEAKSTLFMNTLISVGLIESMPIIALVVALIILFAIKVL